VPEPLRSGDHARIERWRRAHSLRRTIDRRPDLLVDRPITPADHELLAEFGLDEPTR
jgi:tRNA (guanine37-N1)-methyltransferase